MIEQLTNVMVESGAEWVLWMLFALSFASIAVFLERSWAYRRLGGDIEALVPRLRAVLKSEDREGLARLSADGANVLTRVVAAGLAEADHGARSAKEAMNAAMGLERARLERRLRFLATVGNNAPFVGLLGTVIGVVGAFDELGRPRAMVGAMQAASGAAPERLMGTISEALVATAVGLVVAIPAVAAFNALQGRVTSVLNDAETLSHLVIAHLSRRPRATLNAHARRRREQSAELPTASARVEQSRHPSAVGAE